ncbi:MAG: helix-turn-helix domain-containing protein [Deltaproteobacteria bacterium]|nr:helix-turn-helix domain-containing protein [Deltaproteobacteria bacterium]
MDKEMFKELVESVRQGGAILKGRLKSKRTFKVREFDVSRIRKKLRLSQDKFATLMGISVATLRNWEQGRRKPDGPARVLLGVAAMHPEVLPDVVGF